MHNSKSIRRLRTIRTPNDGTTIRDLPFLELVRAACMRAKIDELWFQTRVASCVDVLHTERLIYYRRCLLSVLELDARYEWRVTPPNTHRSRFPVVLKNMWNFTLSYVDFHPIICGRSTYPTTTVLLEKFFVWFRVAWETDWTATAPDTYRSFSGTTLCAYIAST